jgi:hypothetical protein
MATRVRSTNAHRKRRNMGTPCREPTDLSIRAVSGRAWMKVVTAGLRTLSERSCLWGSIPGPPLPQRGTRRQPKVERSGTLGHPPNDTSPQRGER